MKKRVYIQTRFPTGITNDYFLRDYTPSFKLSMALGDEGFWYSKGHEIQLDAFCPSHTFYKKTWADIPFVSEMDTAHYTLRRDRVNKEGLEVLICYHNEATLSKAIVICLGGPIVPIPNLFESNSIYQFFLQQNYALIVPLRRGVSGIYSEWELALEGHYGDYDIQDTLSATYYILQHYPQIIDTEKLFLYGASYGGYVAMLIAGKANDNHLFKAIVAHCGVYDLGEYPYHSSGIASDTMRTYGGTTDTKEYLKTIKEISPKTYVRNWDVPVFLIHHLNDTSSWFGQSVMAYNDALRANKQVRLMLVPGPHSYNIALRNQLFIKIASYFKYSLL